jgi:hypothetical protein
MARGAVMDKHTQMLGHHARDPSIARQLLTGASPSTRHGACY